MSNFKRKGPKSTRSGCLLCKPHKAMGNAKYKDVPNIMRANQNLKEQVYA